MAPVCRWSPGWDARGKRILSGAGLAAFRAAGDGAADQAPMAVVTLTSLPPPSLLGTMNTRPPVPVA